MSRKMRVVLIHVLSWILFFLLPVLFLRASGLLVSDDMQLFILGHIIRTSFLAIIFYLNYIWLVPGFLSNKKQWVFFLINVLVLVVILIISRNLSKAMGLMSNVGGSPRALPAFILTNLIILILGIGVAFGIYLYTGLKRAEMQKTEIELSYLKARLNPHFLFNTLNAIYALSVRRSELTADAVSRLSSIMRYVITESGSDKVYLEKELEYISDFVELQKLRLTGKTKVVFRSEGITAGKKIVPLLLISFVENAFKYGVSTELDSVIDVFIDIRGDELSLHVENTKVSMNAKREGGGLGLETARQLLEHFYPNRYTLSMSDNPTTFIVDLKFTLV